LFQHAPQKSRDLFSLQLFDADTNDGGRPRPRKSQLRVEIRIESNEDLAPAAGLIEDSSIIGGRKTYVSDVFRIEP
jgi:hypothetical protein